MKKNKCRYCGANIPEGQEVCEIHQGKYENNPTAAPAASEEGRGSE